MADDFKALIEEQKLTNQLLLTDQNTRLEYDRQQALKEDAEREAAEKAAKETQEEQKKTRSLLNRLTFGMLGTGGSAKKLSTKILTSGFLSAIRVLS